MRYSTLLSVGFTRVAALAIAPVLLATGLFAQTPECPGYDPDDGIIWGVVRATEGGVPVPGANVTVRWSGGDTRAQTLRNGIYIVCGVKTDVPVVVQAGIEQFESRGVASQLAVGETVEVPLSVSFGGTAAQAVTGRIVGTVIDRETMRPVSNALVGTVADGYTNVTDGAGRFRLNHVPPGQQQIAVRHLAYGETESTFQMPSDGTLELEVRLDPAVVPVAPIEVEIIGTRSHKLEMSGYYERKEWHERLGLGDYLTRQDIEERGSAQVSHLLAEVPRLSFHRGGCFGSRCDFPIFAGTSAHCGRYKEEGGEYLIGASVYVDGVRQRMATAGFVTGIDDMMKPGDVAGIEVYSGSGELPGEFADFNAQRCGAIVIWTGR